METKEQEMCAAIRNFHKIYYREDAHPLDIHHAAEHLFDAAGITISISPTGANLGYFQDAVEKKEPAPELKKAWEKINAANDSH